jgi:hypothetical protein
MLARWPLLPEVRNWWIHARGMEWTTWFSDGVYRLQPDGGAIPVIDVSMTMEMSSISTTSCASLWGPCQNRTTEPSSAIGSGREFSAADETR